MSIFKSSKKKFEEKLKVFILKNWSKIPDSYFVDQPKGCKEPGNQFLAIQFPFKYKGADLGIFYIEEDSDGSRRQVGFGLAKACCEHCYQEFSATIPFSNEVIKVPTLNLKKQKILGFN